MEPQADATAPLSDVVTSADGTRIAYSRRGSGPAVVLVGGGLDDGSENEPLAEHLATQFTVFNYARRGRGDSGDTAPYAVEREVEDLAAIIAAAGGRASLFGASSGGMFVLEACAAGLPVDAVAVWEVPYDLAPGSAERVAEYREQLDAVLATGDRGAAVGLFMRLAGATDDDVAGAAASPFWPGAVALAHTLAYDAALYGPPPTDRLAMIAQRVLVATGGSNEYFERAADEVATGLSTRERLVLEGEGHVADPAVLSDVLFHFFLT